MRTSISPAARDLKVLGRLAIVPGLTAGVLALGVLVFTFLANTEWRAIPWWFGRAVAIAIIAAVVLGWLASRVRTGSTRIIGVAAPTLTVAMVSVAVWQTAAGGATVDVVMTALTPTIVAASTFWAWHVARRLQTRAPDRFARPHATRRLSVPRDARALRALVPAALGALQVLLTLLGIIALAPLLRGGAVSVSYSIFMPTAYRHFRRVRAVLALRAQEVRLQDQRSPVLLLRSFADDELVLKRTKQFLVNVTKTTLSLEEQIVAQLWEVGPVVAIGQPSLALDPIGAARERIVGSLWQRRVQALIEECALVVVVLGQTEGLFWEYEQLSQRRVSVLAILPPSSADALLDRWQRFTVAYPPARGVLLEEAAEFPLLVWFHPDHEPLVVSGQPRDERSYELAFVSWHQQHRQLTMS